MSLTSLIFGLGVFVVTILATLVGLRGLPREPVDQ